MKKLPTIEEQLRKLGFTVEEFDSYHRRVNGEFDFWRNAHHRAFQWHDRFTGDRGAKWEQQIVDFIQKRLSRTQVECDKEEFVRRLTQIGWTQADAEMEWNKREESSKCTSKA